MRLWCDCKQLLLPRLDTASPDCCRCCESWTQYDGRIEIDLVAVAMCGTEKRALAEGRRRCTIMVEGRGVRFVRSVVSTKFRYSLFIDLTPFFDY